MVVSVLALVLKEPAQGNAKFDEAAIGHGIVLHYAEAGRSVPVVNRAVQAMTRIGAPGELVV